MFLFVFWIISFGVPQIFHIVKSVPLHEKVKNHYSNDSPVNRKQLKISTKTKEQTSYFLLVERSPIVKNNSLYFIYYVLSFESVSLEVSSLHRDFSRVSPQETSREWR